MKKTILTLTLLLATITNFAQLTDGIYARMETTKGTILLNLEYKKTPLTVANFISLAEGTNTKVDEKYKNKPFYDGLKFHRVIANFMIQGGDPLGSGAGGPGYKFKDEFDSTLKHSKEGILSMANSGPATNGSQFFITHKETSWLNNKHSVFGSVVEGMNVVNAIVQGDEIKTVRIERIGDDAKNFNATQIFSDFFAKSEIEKKSIDDITSKILTAKKKFIESTLSKGIKTDSGLQYTFLNKANGNKPEEGKTVFIHYAGYFENGDLFDSSYENVAKEYQKYDENRKSSGGYAPFPFEYGRKEGLIPGFIEALGQMKYGDKLLVKIPYNLAYGENDYGPIPGKSNLIFEIEMLENKPQ